MALFQVLISLFYASGGPPGGPDFKNLDKWGWVPEDVFLVQLKGDLWSSHRLAAANGLAAKRLGQLPTVNSSVWFGDLSLFFFLVLSCGFYCPQVYNCLPRR
jgi:hypothetical protein